MKSTPLFLKISEERFNGYSKLQNGTPPHCISNIMDYFLTPAVPHFSNSHSLRNNEWHHNRQHKPEISMVSLIEIALDIRHKPKLKQQVAL